MGCTSWEKNSFIPALCRQSETKAPYTLSTWTEACKTVMRTRQNDFMHRPPVLHALFAQIQIAPDEPAVLEHPLE